ncbi:bifunctional 3'-5' exonuclease/ATP-dependent helicase WRN-like [Saccostrea echinata]|uniref:bifunctional 3'-5' exonuclease/ATP-dependent helicase WRN-like n=1 Tax=Saccostrea echinata TaxID=191078 RepID=UPI002A8400EA|nr:bifunctional 3'-5' exonuclease/ATP-dependent helicase WRN-like [Saccostrea echinata]
MAADMALQKYNLMFDQNISALKPLQQKSLESLLHHDVVAILPTGYGKSLLYELLPFYHLEVTGNPAVVLVIEPLNVIIEEQMKKLSDSSFLLRNSSSYDFIKDFEKGKTMYIFAHPEAVVGKPEVYKLLQSVSDYMYIVVDEAHCILDWGHDFRPIFREIKQLRAVRPDAKFLALSATVSVNGVVDITKFLGMENPKLIKTSPLRDNLSLIVLRRPSRKVSTQASYDYIFENVFCDLKRNEEDYPVTLIYCVGINWVGYGYEVLRTILLQIKIQVAQRILGDDMFDGVRDIEHARVVMFHSSIGRDEER